jgi:hypothetical protein
MPYASGVKATGQFADLVAPENFQFNVATAIQPRHGVQSIEATCGGRRESQSLNHDPELKAQGMVEIKNHLTRFPPPPEWAVLPRIGFSFVKRRSHPTPRGFAKPPSLIE